MSKDLNPELIRLFYDLWEGALPGREYVLSADLPDSLEKLPRSEAANVQRTLRHLNRVGHLIAEGPLDGAFVSSLVGKEVIRIVARIRPLLEEARARREEPDYLQYVDGLYETCRKAYPDYEPKYPSTERRGFGLAGQA